MDAKLASSERGMTLMELLLALVLAMVLGAVSLPQVRRYWQSYRLDGATQSLTSVLEVARYTAVSTTQDVVVSFSIPESFYEAFEDRDGDRVRDPGERVLGRYTLPSQIVFSGTGLLGPPSSPSAPVADAITFSPDMVIFNSFGKLANGLGVIYVQNEVGDASAISFNIAGRMKTYRWDKSRRIWR
ncbi:MAG: GspH/FimT family protein [Acidobacteriota bacterium]